MVGRQALTQGRQMAGFAPDFSLAGFLSTGAGIGDDLPEGAT